MNLLEHYIKEVHSVDDVSNIFEEANGFLPKEPFLKIDLTYDCHGAIGRNTRYFYKSEWEDAQKKGYFMA